MKSLQEFKSKTVIQEEVETEEISETVMTSSDYKISPSGRKVRARRFKISDDPTTLDDEEQEDEKKDVKEELELVEAKTKSPVKGLPPFTLVLKRKAIRQYPGDTRVALYWSEKLKTYFSVPYQDKDGDVSGIIQAESVIDTLKKIVNEKKEMTVEFASGHSHKIDYKTASAIANVYENLSEENQNKFANMLHESPEHFSKAVNFALKHTK